MDAVFSEGVSNSPYLCMQTFLSGRCFSFRKHSSSVIHSQSTLCSTTRPSFQSTILMSSPMGGPLKRKIDNTPSSSPAEAKKPKSDGSITSFFGAPKLTVNSSKPASTANGFSSASATTSKFDKAKWVAKLTPEQRTLLKLEIDTLDESWLAHLKDEVIAPGFLDLKRFLKSEIDSGKKVFPPMEEVYSWFVTNFPSSTSTSNLTSSSIT